MLYDIIVSEPSTSFCVTYNHVIMTVTSMTVCDSHV